MLSCYQDFSSLDKEKATKLLISAIHQTDEVSPSLLDASLPYHIKVATDVFQKGPLCSFVIS